MICDHGTNDGSYVAPELEVILHSRGESRTLANGTGQCGIVIRRATTIGVGEVVVEGTTNTVVAEALGDFDDAHEEGAGWQGVGHVS